MAHRRPYRGIDAAERLARRRRRLLEAGLDLLGTPDADPLTLTIRAICQRAEVALRYFYEAFADKDEFVGAVYDWVVADIAATTQTAVAAAPLAEQTRAAMANIVRTISGDARVGRLLFSVELSNAVVARKRVESTGLFATLLGQHVSGTTDGAHPARVKATTHFVVGGVGQLLGAWLSGDVGLDDDQLVDQLTRLLEELSEPRLVRE